MGNLTIIKRRCILRFHYINMEQQFLKYLVALKNDQLEKGYHLQAFKKLTLSENLPEQVIGFMSNELFAACNNIFSFMQQSIKDKGKEQEEVRLLLYKLTAEFIKMRQNKLVDYADLILKNLSFLFSRQHTDKLKIEALKAISKSFKHIKFQRTEKQLQNVHDFAHNLIKQLKSSKSVPTLKGTMWYVSCILYNVFPDVFDKNQKKEMQEALLRQLQSTIQSDKHLSTISNMVKSLSETLSDNQLDAAKITKYFNMITVLMIPLKSTYDVPKSALKALKANASFFHSHIMQQGKQIFESVLTLMSHQNKQLKQAASQALEVVNVEIVKGIFSDPERYSQLYNQIIGRLWEIIKQKIPNQSSLQQKTESQAGKMATVLKIIGDLSQVIVQLSGSEQLEKMFQKLIQILDSRTFKSFDVSELEANEAVQNKFQKSSSFVHLLYNQRLVCSYLSAFGKILPYLSSITYTQVELLEKVWLLSIKQYPNYYEKYIPNLINSMVLFLNGFSFRRTIFQKWLNKMILVSLKQTLDLNRFMISSNQDYYVIVKRSYEIWFSLLTQLKWQSQALAIFTETLFECIEFQLLNLDITYRKTVDDTEPSNQIANIFSGVGKQSQAINISEYQYMYSLTLVFEHLLIKLVPAYFSPRLYHFYIQILRKFKNYPKSIPLMKLCRSLNEYMIKISYLAEISKVESNELIFVINDVASQIFQHLLTFENVFLYDSLKMLLSLPLQIIVANDYRFLKTKIAVVIKKALDLGNETQSLAYMAIKCLERLFLSKQRKIMYRYLSDVLSNLEKYISHKQPNEKLEQDANLSLWQLQVSKIKMVDEILSFLGKLGGYAHNIVANQQNVQSKAKYKNDVLNLKESSQSCYVGWDYNAQLYFSIPLPNYTLDINIPQILPRLCHLMLNSQSYVIKLNASQLLHSIIIYLIGKSATNPNQKSVSDDAKTVSFKKIAASIYEKVLPFVFKVSCNVEHPSYELMRTLSVHLVRFLSNTQQPDSPDVLIVITLLLQLLSYSQDISDFASKCLVELIKYNIKQNPNKEYPLFKMVMRNMWPLALSKRPGTVTFIIQILKVVHRQEDLISKYILQFYSFVLTLSKTNNPITTQLKYLLEKLILITKKLIHLLKINTNKQNSKFRNIYEVIDYLYVHGFTSSFRQQREVSAILFEQILTKCDIELRINVIQFLKKKSLSKNILFGTLFTILDFQIFSNQQVMIQCSKMDSQTQIWTIMAESSIFERNQILNYVDLSEIYFASAKNFLQFLYGQEFRQNCPVRISIESTNALLLSFIKLINLIHTLLSRNDQHKVTSTVNRQIMPSFLVRTLMIMFLKPQSILERVNYDMFMTEYSSSFSQLKIIFAAFAHEDFFIQFKQILSQLYNYQWKRALVQQLIESITVFDIQLQIYLKGQAQINSLLLLSKMNEFGRKWVELEIKTILRILSEEIDKQSRNDEKVMTRTKIRNLLNFALTNAIEAVVQFTVRQIMSNSKMFQIFQKEFFEFASKNWGLVGQKILSQYLNQIHISKIVLGLIKYLNPQHCSSIAQFLSSNQNHRDNLSILEQELKLNFFLIDDVAMPTKYVQYLHFIIKEGMDPKNTIKIHESSLNLIGLVIQNHMWNQSDAPYFSRMLTDMVSIYLPISTSTLKNQSQQTYLKFLKVIRNFVVLCGNIEFFIPILPIFYKSNKQNTSQFIEELLDEYISNCFAVRTPMEQSLELRTILEMYLNENFDKEVINNKRITIASIFIQKMISKISSLEILVLIFNQYVARLLPLTKLEQYFPSQDQYLLKIQLKTMTFNIFEYFYKALPPKRVNEDVHQHNHHKTLIIEANETLKNEFKNESLLQDLDKNQKYPFSALGLLHSLWHSAYNLLIILFISTQKNQEQFKNYLFDRKQFRTNILWEHIVDPKKTDMGFEVTTSFKVMKLTQKTIKPLKSKIKKKYMSNSLFVINEQIIPKSQLDNAVKIEDIQFQDDKQSKVQGTRANENTLELDVINTHPCMNNLLILIDFLTVYFVENRNFEFPTSQFKQFSQLSQLSQLSQALERMGPSMSSTQNFRQHQTPGWIRSIYDELTKPDTPLSIQVFLLKLILNRPQVFCQDIWLPILIKYLGYSQNGSRFFHYFYRDVAKQAISFFDAGIKIEGKLVCLAVNKMLAMLPHPQNPYLFSDNIYIFQRMLEQKKVYVDQKVLTRMFFFEEGKENYLQWRMTGIIALKISLMCRVPVLSSYQQLLAVDSSLERYRFVLKLLEGDLRAIFRFFGQSKVKYCIAAAGLVGQILRIMDEIASHNLALSIKDKVALQLVGLAKGKTRTQRERFCLIVNQICQIYPVFLRISRINTHLQDAIYTAVQKDKVFIFDSFKIHFEQITKSQLQDFDIFEDYCMTVKNCAERVAGDGPDVHRAFLNSLSPIVTSSSCMSKPPIQQTFSKIFETLQKIYSSSNQAEILEKYYNIVVILDNLTKSSTLLYDDSQFKTALKISVIKGLASPIKQIRNILTSYISKYTKKSLLPPQNLLYLLDQFYIPSVQQLWLTTATPLVLGMTRNSIFYDRVLFEERLDSLAVYYDWDYRKGKNNHASQPYTPAYTLNTQFVKKEALGSIVALNSLIASQNKIEKYEGMIKASQGFGDEIPIFTQPMGNSFASSVSDHQFPRIGGTQASMFNDYQKTKFKKSKQMSKFAASNAFIHDKFSVVNGNRLRFGKPNQTRKDKQYYTIKQSQMAVQLNKKKQKPPLLRKYKLGQLPDIQITGKDLIDPLIQLTSQDEEFASQLLGMLFEQMCRNQKDQELFTSKFKEAVLKITQQTTKYNFMFISIIMKMLITFSKVTEESVDFDIKKITFAGNCYDHSILYIQENLIKLANQQNPKHKFNLDDYLQKIIYMSDKQRVLFLDLLDLHHKINQTDGIPAILDKTLPAETKQKLHKALKAKEDGNLAQSISTLQKLQKTEEMQNRIQDFITQEYLQCLTLLQKWENVSEVLKNKAIITPLTKSQTKIFSLSLIGQYKQLSQHQYEWLDFKKYNLFYEEALLSFSSKGVPDTSRYLLKQQLNSFINSYNKISIFALQSKHQLIQSLQKIYEFEEFLDLFQNTNVSISDCKQLFFNWCQRDPSAIYDSHITTSQITQSRKRFAQLVQKRFTLKDDLVLENYSKWLHQHAKIMIKQGLFGSAEIVLRNALTLQTKTSTNSFLWQIYKTIGKLKIKKSFLQGSVKQEHNVLQKFQLLPNLIQKQFTKIGRTDIKQQLELNILRIQYYEAFLELYEGKVRKDGCPKELENSYLQASSRSFKIIGDIYKHVLTPNTQTSIASFKTKRKIALLATCFAEKMLSLLEGNKQIVRLKEPMRQFKIHLDTILQLFGAAFIRSLSMIGFGDAEHGTMDNTDYKICFLILKFLKVCQFHHKTMDVLLSEIVDERKVPIWVFLHFLPQIVSTINAASGKQFERFIMTIAQQYPEALIYPFNSVFEERNQCTSQVSKSVFDFIHDEYPWHFVMIQAMDQLNHPELRLMDALYLLFDKTCEEIAIRDIKHILNPNVEYRGVYNRKFASIWNKYLEPIISDAQKGKNSGDNIKKMCLMLQEFTQIQDGYGKLSNFSLFFETYGSSDIPRFRLMTQPYKLGEQPLKDQMIKIQSFDQTILTLKSLRRPKKLTMFGNNEKKYSVLVKGGEDLKVDQRILQIFSVMNAILSKNVESENREHCIRRYETIPIRKSIGLIQWVDHTEALKEFLQKQFCQMKNNFQLDLYMKNEAYAERLLYLKSINEQSITIQMHIQLLSRNEVQVIAMQKRSQSLIPYGTLRKGIQKLSKSYDSFLYLKNKFINNYAVCCAACYILGIGDRHLENFLIDVSSATIVMIDFGRSFDLSLDLKLPELVPFRLTKCFTQLMDPIGLNGSFKVNLIHALKSFRMNYNQILDFAQIFITDPVLDWIKIAKKKPIKIEQEKSEEVFQVQIQEVPTEHQSYFTTKIEVVKKKLLGYHPKMLLIESLNETIHKQKNYMQSIKQNILRMNQIDSEQILTLEEESEVLISIATDPNVIGRAYTGWEPWI